MLKSNRFVALALITMAASACGSDEAQTPTRPSSVPTAARWIGGVDGGDWIACQQRDQKSMSCQMFADVTGAIVDRGVFATRKEQKHAVGTNEFFAEMSYFDGERIKLKDGTAYEKVLEAPLAQ